LSTSMRPPVRIGFGEEGEQYGGHSSVIRQVSWPYNPRWLPHPTASEESMTRWSN
jgi:hypothetical protein